MDPNFYTPRSDNYVAALHQCLGAKNMKARLGTITLTRMSLHIVLLLLCLLFLGCEPSKMSSEKVTPENKIKNTASKKPPDPWSNEILWKNLVENQTHASFSVKINDTLPEFTFIMHGKFKCSRQLKGNYFHPSFVEIIDLSNSKIIQKIENKGRFDNVGDGFDELDLAFADLVQMVDLNQDGYLDLRILHDTGATGNNFYATFLYDPVIGQFRFHETLSLLSAVTVDQKSNLITTYWRNHGCDEFREYFHLEKTGTLILEKVEWTEMDVIHSETGCYKFTAIPRDTRMLDRLGYVFFNTRHDKFAKMLHTKVKVVKKEEFRGRLDGKQQTILGTPVDREPMSP